MGVNSLPKTVTPLPDSDSRKDFLLFSRPWPCAYFLNEPNAAASIAPTLSGTGFQSLLTSRSKASSVPKTAAIRASVCIQCQTVTDTGHRAMADTPLAD